MFLTNSELKKRILIGILLLLSFVPVFFCKLYFFIFIWLIFGISIYEIFKNTKHKFHFLLKILIFIGFGCGLFFLWNKKLDLQSLNHSLFFFLFYFVSLFILNSFLVIYHKDNLIIDDIFYLNNMFFLTLFGLLSLIFIYSFEHGKILLTFFLLSIVINDVVAYLSGTYLGRNRLNPIVSPNKTLEGFVCGHVFSCLVSFLFGFFLIEIRWYYTLLLSFFLPIFASLGDLFFSAVKRFLNVKDYSHILGVHGGVLDRFDSILFSAPIFLLIFLLVK